MKYSLFLPISIAIFQLTLQKTNSDLNLNSLNCVDFCTKGDTCHIGHNNPTDNIINRLCIHPNARVILLQIIFIKSSRILFPFERFRNVSITRNASAYSKRPLPCWRSFAEFRTFCSYQQNQFPNQFSLLKSFGFHLFVIPLANSGFIRLNIHKSLQPMASQIFQFIFHQSRILISRQLILKCDTSRVKL